MKATSTKDLGNSSRHLVDVDAVRQKRATRQEMLHTKPMSWVWDGRRER